MKINTPREVCGEQVEGESPAPLVTSREEYERITPGQKYKLKNKKGIIVTTIKPLLDDKGRPLWSDE